MKVLLIIALTVLSGNILKAQDDWMRFPAGTSFQEDTANVKHVELRYGAQQKGKVTLHQDARLEKLNEFVRSGESTVGGVKIDGFRIVIFFDQDKSTVSQQKANFLARYSDCKAYIDYVAPNYRVRVGNFRTKLEAEGFKTEILTYFPTAVVVDDKIQLPELPEQL